MAAEENCNNIRGVSYTERSRHPPVKIEPLQIGISKRPSCRRRRRRQRQSILYYNIREHGGIIL